MFGFGRTYYDVLGVAPSATYEELENAHQKVLRSNATERFSFLSRAIPARAVEEANTAWAVISDWTTRLEYNAKIGKPQLEDEQRIKEGYLRNQDHESNGDQESEDFPPPQGSQRPQENTREPFSLFVTFFGSWTQTGTRNRDRDRVPSERNEANFFTSSNPFYSGFRHIQEPFEPFNFPQPPFESWAQTGSHGHAPFWSSQTNSSTSSNLFGGGFRHNQEPLDPSHTLFGSRKRFGTQSRTPLESRQTNPSTSSYCPRSSGHTQAPSIPSHTPFGSRAQPAARARVPLFGDSQTNSSTSSNFFGRAFGSPRDTNGTRDNSPNNDSDTADHADSAPPYAEGASRYTETDSGTEIHITISKWRLSLNLSSKFKFLNDVAELSDRRENKSVSFQLGLQYNTDSREAFDATINELTVQVESLPSELGEAEGEDWGVARLETVFKESASDMPTLRLRLTLTAESLPEAECHMPWEFGFDFDLSQGVRSHRRGTCLIFSREEFPEYFQYYVGADSPEFVLKKDNGVNANFYKDLGGEKVLKMKYGSVTMWRLAAVGWRG